MRKQLGEFNSMTGQIFQILSRSNWTSIHKQNNQLVLKTSLEIDYIFKYEIETVKLLGENKTGGNL